MEGKGLSMRMWVAVIVSMMVVVGGRKGEAASCPSTGQLANACSQYVLGQNPPVPPASGGCCNLLKSSSASCLCSAIPANARSLVSKKGLSNIRSSCKIGNISCPGVGK